MFAKTLARFSLRLGLRGIIPLPLVLGLLMAPVTCTCGAAIPHSHSLFQLPHHNHAAPHHADDHDHDHAAMGHSGHSTHVGPHVSSPKVAGHIHLSFGDGCSSSDHSSSRVIAGNFALSNALEQHDGWVLKAPPSSSFGQPTVMTQPSSSVNVAASPCESIDLPVTRTLEGTETSPETPPPRI